MPGFVVVCGVDVSHAFGLAGWGVVSGCCALVFVLGGGCEDFLPVGALHAGVRAFVDVINAVLVHTQHAGDVSLSVVPADGAVDEVPGDGGGGVLGGWCWWQCVGFELVVVPVA